MILNKFKVFAVLFFVIFYTGTVITGAQDIAALNSSEAIEKKDEASAEKKSDEVITAPLLDSALNAANQKDEKIYFNEIWGYLLRGEEGKLRGDEPITDIGYFSAGLSYKAKLTGAYAFPFKSSKLPKGARVHFVVAEINNSSKLHFALNPKLGYRKKLISDIVSASKGFNGIQIDFEAVKPHDAYNFLSFLTELRRKMNHKQMLSVALPARKSKIYDAYDYEAISKIADRIIIMAYDQHWSTSAPGPVASLPWCRSISDYAKTIVPRDKLIMGMPLYGRSWNEKNYSRSVRYNEVLEDIKKNNRELKFDENLGPHYTYEESVRVFVFFDDIPSLVDKMKLYKTKIVRGVAFWRIGQGPNEIWGLMGSDK